MCSIVAGFDTEKVKELCKLNEYRGTMNHSIFYIQRYSMDVCSLERGIGPLDIDSINIPEDHYCIIHQQAPTGGDNSVSMNIHPAQIGDRLLWHNGIVKEDCIAQMQAELECTSTWDTKLILRQLIDFDTPQGIDGTFSCIYYDTGTIIIFRNEISPLFYDKDMNFSSTKFEGSEPVPPNMMWYLETSLGKEQLHAIKEFTTVENPYYFGDE